MPRRSFTSRQTRLLLAAFTERPRVWCYGYALSKSTGLKSGTLYPLLIRLSDHGLLEARWEDAAQPGRPPRHAYRLTTKGLAFAEAQAQQAVPAGVPDAGHGAKA